MLSNITQCTDCPAGYYCQDRGATAPTGKCKAGHICFSLATGREPVYNNDSTDGKIIVTYGDRCHAGRYCPEGTVYMIPCPLGTYLPTLGGEKEADCLPCDPGMYCNGTGLTAVSGKNFRYNRHL